MNTQLAVVQSNLSGKLHSTLTRTWVGYSDTRQSYFEGQVEIVGNIFDGNGLGGIGIDLNGSSTVANAHNNIVRNFEENHCSVKEVCIAIRIDSGNARANIKNNHIQNNCDTNSTEEFLGIGILVSAIYPHQYPLTYYIDNYVGHGNPDSSRIWKCEFGLQLKM